MDFKQVTKDEFFKAMGPLDVSPHIVGSFPYTQEMKTRAGVVVGKSVDFYPEGKALYETNYFLVEGA